MKSSGNSFVHLHLHSEFSMLDGAARIEDAVNAAAADGQPAIGLTDHGVLYGTIDFVKASYSAGVKPVIGVEGYLTSGSRYDRPAAPDNVRYHITLLAENQAGYSNLIKLVSRSYMEGYYYKPRMDLDLLSEHSEGVIATTGCLGGQIPQLINPEASYGEGNIILSKDMKAAVETAGQYQDIFGKERFFVELHNHGLEAQKQILPDLLHLSNTIGAPLLATNDVHYTHREEAATHDALLCVQTNTQITDPNRFKFHGEEFYLKTAEEMRSLFPDDEFPDACDNTLRIAERVDVSFDFNQSRLPNFTVPEGMDSISYLREKVTEGSMKRYDGDISGETAERIEHEMKIIGDMGFADYFLIVWDLVRHAKENGIRVGPGRGSAAGSIVAYSLGITDLDPLRYGLIFERFLNPGRNELPDIDIDFDERRRADIISYAADKYGVDHVAQVVTFSTIKGRQAIRDSTRLLGKSYPLGDKLAKLMPPAVLGRETTLDVCFGNVLSITDPLVKEWHSKAEELRSVYRTDVDAQQVLDTARGLEGLRRQDSIHAAAVVISPVPLTDLVPIQRKGEGAEVVTQFDMHSVEDLGLLKIDILGLRTLATIDRCLALIEQNRGEVVDIDRVGLDDAATYEMLCQGNTIGVFQLEGSAMRSLMRSLQPDCLDDLIALVALYRPGPMSNNWHIAYANRKNKREKVMYPHPATEGILDDTYGLMIYQEQVMQIARDVAGYSMSDADSLRKAMGKKVSSIMSKERKRFIDGAAANGLDRDLGKSLFNSIEGFSGYGFNKSHSAAYGLLAYQTAYLKKNYPAEYMAALLTSSKQDKDKTSLYLNECRALNIEVMTPSVNMSESDFTVRDEKIVFGLSAVRNVGEGMVEQILAARGEDGTFIDFQDFVDRVHPTALNKRLVVSLIKAGSFDQMGHSRKGLSLVYETMLDRTLERRRHEDRGQYSLFIGEEDQTADTDGFNDTVEIPEVEWDNNNLLAFEKEMLGLYVSDHPLKKFEDSIRGLSVVFISEISEMTDNSRVKVYGIVGGIERRHTRTNEIMMFFKIEDLSGRIDVIAFPKTASKSEHLIKEDAVLLIEGTLNLSDTGMKIRAYNISAPVLTTPELKLSAQWEVFSSSSIKGLKHVLSGHPGDDPVLIDLVSDKNRRLIRLGDQFKVDSSSDKLRTEIKNLLGDVLVDA